MCTVFVYYFTYLVYSNYYFVKNGKIVREIFYLQNKNLNNSIYFIIKKVQYKDISLWMNAVSFIYNVIDCHYKYSFTRFVLW